MSLLKEINTSATERSELDTFLQKVVESYGFSSWEQLDEKVNDIYENVLTEMRDQGDLEYGGNLNMTDRQARTAGRLGIKGANFKKGDIIVYNNLKLVILQDNGDSLVLYDPKSKKKREEKKEPLFNIRNYASKEVNGRTMWFMRSKRDNPPNL